MKNLRLIILWLTVLVTLSVSAVMDVQIQNYKSISKDSLTFDLQVSNPRLDSVGLFFEYSTDTVNQAWNSMRLRTNKISVPSGIITQSFAWDLIKDLGFQRLDSLWLRVRVQNTFEEGTLAIARVKITNDSLVNQYQKRIAYQVYLTDTLSFPYIQKTKTFQPKVVFLTPESMWPKLFANQLWMQVQVSYNGGQTWFKKDSALIGTLPLSANVGTVSSFPRSITDSIGQDISQFQVKILVKDSVGKYVDFGSESPEYVREQAALDQSWGMGILNTKDFLFATSSPVSMDSVKFTKLNSMNLTLTPDSLVKTVFDLKRVSGVVDTITQDTVALDELLKIHTSGLARKSTYTPYTQWYEAPKGCVIRGVEYNALMGSLDTAYLYQQSLSSVISKIVLPTTIGSLSNRFYTLTYTFSSVQRDSLATGAKAIQVRLRTDSTLKERRIQVPRVVLTCGNTQLRMAKGTRVNGLTQYAISPDLALLDTLTGSAYGFTRKVIDSNILLRKDSAFATLRLYNAKQDSLNKQVRFQSLVIDRPNARTGGCRNGKYLRFVSPEYFDLDSNRWIKANISNPLDSFVVTNCVSSPNLVWNYGTQLSTKSRTQGLKFRVAVGDWDTTKIKISATVKDSVVLFKGPAYEYRYLNLNTNQQPRIVFSKISGGLNAQPVQITAALDDPDGDTLWLESQFSLDSMDWRPIDVIYDYTNLVNGKGVRQITWDWQKSLNEILYIQNRVSQVQFKQKVFFRLKAKDQRVGQFADLSVNLSNPIQLSASIDTVFFAKSKLSWGAKIPVNVSRVVAGSSKVRMLVLSALKDTLYDSTIVSTQKSQRLNFLLNSKKLQLNRDPLPMMAYVISSDTIYGTGKGDSLAFQYADNTKPAVDSISMFHQYGMDSTQLRFKLKDKNKDSVSVKLVVSRKKVLTNDTLVLGWLQMNTLDSSLWVNKRFKGVLDTNNALDTLLIIVADNYTTDTIKQVNLNFYNIKPKVSVIADSVAGDTLVQKWVISDSLSADSLKLNLGFKSKTDLTYTATSLMIKGLKDSVWVSRDYWKLRSPSIKDTLWVKWGGFRNMLKSKLAAKDTLYTRVYLKDTLYSDTLLRSMSINTPPSLDSVLIQSLKSDTLNFSLRASDVDSDTLILKSRVIFKSISGADTLVGNAIDSLRITYPTRNNTQKFILAKSYRFIDSVFRVSGSGLVKPTAKNALRLSLELSDDFGRGANGMRLITIDSSELPTVRLALSQKQNLNLPDSSSLFTYQILPQYKDSLVTKYLAKIYRKRTKASVQVDSLYRIVPLVFTDTAYKMDSIQILSWLDQRTYLPARVNIVDTAKYLASAIYASEMIDRTVNTKDTLIDSIKATLSGTTIKRTGSVFTLKSSYARPFCSVSRTCDTTTHILNGQLKKKSGTIIALSWQGATRLYLGDSLTIDTTNRQFTLTGADTLFKSVDTLKFWTTNTWGQSADTSFVLWGNQTTQKWDRARIDSSSVKWVRGDQTTWQKGDTAAWNRLKLSFKVINLTKDSAQYEVYRYARGTNTWSKVTTSQVISLDTLSDTIQKNLSLNVDLKDTTYTYDSLKIVQKITSLGNWLDTLKVTQGDSIANPLGASSLVLSRVNARKWVRLDLDLKDTVQNDLVVYGLEWANTRFGIYNQLRSMGSRLLACADSACLVRNKIDTTLVKSNPFTLSPRTLKTDTLANNRYVTLGKTSLFLDLDSLNGLAVANQKDSLFFKLKQYSYKGALKDSAIYVLKYDSVPVIDSAIGSVSSAQKYLVSFRLKDSDLDSNLAIAVQMDTTGKGTWKTLSLPTDYVFKSGSLDSSSYGRFHQIEISAASLIVKYKDSLGSASPKFRVGVSVPNGTISWFNPLTYPCVKPVISNVGVVRTVQDADIIFGIDDANSASLSYTISYRNNAKENYQEFKRVLNIPTSVYKGVKDIDSPNWDYQNYINPLADSVQLKIELFNSYDTTRWEAFKALSSSLDVAEPTMVDSLYRMNAYLLLPVGIDTAHLVAKVNGVLFKDSILDNKSNAYSVLSQMTLDYNLRSNPKDTLIWNFELQDKARKVLQKDSIFLVDRKPVAKWLALTMVSDSGMRLDYLVSDTVFFNKGTNTSIYTNISFKVGATGLYQSVKAIKNQSIAKLNDSTYKIQVYWNPKMDCDTIRGRELGMRLNAFNTKDANLVDTLVQTYFPAGTLTLSKVSKDSLFYRVQMSQKAQKVWSQYQISDKTSPLSFKWLDTLAVEKFVDTNFVTVLPAAILFKNGTQRHSIQFGGAFGVATLLDTTFGFNSVVNKDTVGFNLYKDTLKVGYTLVDAEQKPLQMYSSLYAKLTNGNSVLVGSSNLDTLQAGQSRVLSYLLSGMKSMSVDKYYVANRYVNLFGIEQLDTIWSNPILPLRGLLKFSKVSHDTLQFVYTDSAKNQDQRVLEMDAGGVIQSLANGVDTVFSNYAIKYKVSPSLLFNSNMKRIKVTVKGSFLQSKVLMDTTFGFNSVVNKDTVGFNLYKDTLKVGYTLADAEQKPLQMYSSLYAKLTNGNSVLVGSSNLDTLQAGQSRVLSYLLSGMKSMSVDKYYVANRYVNLFGAEQLDTIWSTPVLSPKGRLIISQISRDTLYFVYTDSTKKLDYRTLKLTMGQYSTSLIAGIDTSFKNKGVHWAIPASQLYLSNSQNLKIEALGSFGRSSVLTDTSFSANTGYGHSDSISFDNILTKFYMVKNPELRKVKLTMSLYSDLNGTKELIESKDFGLSSIQDTIHYSYARSNLAGKKMDRYIVVANVVDQFGFTKSDTILNRAKLPTVVKSFTAKYDSTSQQISFDVDLVNNDGDQITATISQSQKRLACVLAGKGVLTTQCKLPIDSITSAARIYLDTIVKFDLNTLDQASSVVSVVIKRIPADFNHDQQLDRTDLDSLMKNWKSYEIGSNPNQMSLSMLTPTLDGQNDLADLELLSTAWSKYKAPNQAVIQKSSGIDGSLGWLSASLMDSVMKVTLARPANVKRSQIDFNVNPSQLLSYSSNDFVDIAKVSGRSSVYVGDFLDQGGVSSSFDFVPQNELYYSYSNLMADGTTRSGFGRILLESPKQLNATITLDLKEASTLEFITYSSEGKQLSRQSLGYFAKGTANIPVKKLTSVESGVQIVRIVDQNNQTLYFKQSYLPK